jgi:hypothetical protein
LTADGRAAELAAAFLSQRVVEVRAEGGVAVAVTEAILASAVVPVLHRLVEAAPDVPTSPDAKRTSTRTTLGDVELRVSHLAWQSEPGATTERLGVVVGTKLPTTPIERDAFGRYVQTDLQPGCGSIMPFAGLSWSLTSSIWSLSTFATLLMPFSVREGPHPGDSLRAGAALQLQPTTRFAARVGTTARLDSTGAVDGTTDPRSGGFIMYATPEIIVSPVSDVVVSLGAAIPTVQALRGYHVAAPIAMLGIGVDL